MALNTYPGLRLFLPFGDASRGFFWPDSSGKGDRKDKHKTAGHQLAVAEIAEEFADGLRDLKHVADGMKLAEARAGTPN